MLATLDWLDEGLRSLAVGGLPALRIESLAAGLGATKGSFYHHFVDLADYRRALLAHFEERCTTRHITTNALLAESPVIDRLEALIDAVLAEEQAHRGLEVVMRTWANSDDDARDTVQRVDTLRLDYLTSLFADHLDRPRAEQMARSAYYLLLGSQHVVPPGSVEELRGMWQDMLAPWRNGQPR